MSSAFASFHLTIAAPHGDRYPVTARTQAGHEVSEDLLLPLDDPTLTVYQTALHYHTPIDESVVITVGQLLYRTIFQGAIAEAFATARTHADQHTAALRIHLAIDTDTRLSAAAALPWELMATAAGRPLMLEHALVRTFPWNDPIPALGIPPGERIRLAVTSALPTDLANHPIAAEAEVAAIRTAITHSSRPIDLIEVPHLTRDRLTDLLTNQRPHIVHHIGHGSIQRGMGYLDIERADQSRDRLSAREFSTMLHQSGVQLVVLNACHTSSAGENLLTSFAPIFITDRIPAVIGMQAAILNRTGHCFANAFYAALGHSGSIDQVLIAARKAIHADGHEHGAWGVPTLYSRVPHGGLWQTRQADHTNSTSPPTVIQNTIEPIQAHGSNILIGNQIQGNVYQHIDLPEATLKASLAALEQEKTQARIRHAAQQIESDRLLHLRLKGFVGRVNELTAIRANIEAMRPTGGYVLIKALAGEGKSSIIAKLIQEAGITQTPHHFITLTTGREYQLGLLRAVVAQLILKHNLAVSYFPEEPSAMKAEFVRILDDLSKHGTKETIYLDGLDQLQPEIDGSRDLSFLPPQPPPGIVIVLGSRPDETLKPLEILHRVDYDLPPLSEADALALWQSVQPSVADSLLHDLYTTLKGNAFFVHLAADTMQGASVVDATSLIRQIEQNPQNLFGITLDRIKRLPLSKWDAVWKPMLALLLVAQEPLRLDALGDLLKQDHDTMQDAVWVLGGLVSQGIDQRVALHHLLFRDYLAASVFNQREVKRWHQRLADWCAVNLDAIWVDHSDTIEQARRVYAWHHYITHLSLAENWPTLWQVLDAGDYGEQKTRFDPSTRLYALDLDRGRESAIKAGQSDEEHIHNLPRLWKYSLLRTRLTSRVDQWPDDLFVTLAILGRTQEALERIELVSDPKRQIQLWAAIIAWYDTLQQSIILTRIRRVLHTLSGSAYTESVVLLSQAYTTLHRHTEAIPLLQHAIDHARSITHPDTNAAVLKRISSVAASIGCFDEALSAAQSIHSTWHQCDTSITVLQAIVATGNFTHALTLVQSFSDPLTRTKALCAIVGEAKNPSHAPLLAQAAATAASIDEDWQRGAALQAIVQAHCLLGNLDEATQIASSIADQRSFAEAYSLLAPAHARNGNISHACELAQSISVARCRNAAWRDIAEVCATQNDIHQAWEISQCIDDDRIRADALHTIAEMLVIRGAIRDGIELARFIDPAWNRGRTLSRLALLLFDQGAIDRAIEVAHSIDHPRVGIQALGALTRAMAAQGLHAQASSMIAQVIQRLQAMEPRWNRNKALHTMISMADAPTKRAYAMTILPMIDDLGEFAQAACSIASQYIVDGDRYEASTLIDHALKSIPRMSNTVTQGETCCLIAQTILTMGNAAWAERVLRQALSIAQEHENQSEKAKLLSIIGHTATNDTNFLFYTAILHQARQTALNIPSNNHCTLALYSLVQNAISYGNQGYALETAYMIQDRWLRSMAFGLIAQDAVLHSKYDHALDLYHAIESPWDQVAILSTIAQATITEKYDDALSLLDRALDLAREIFNIGKRIVTLGIIAQTRVAIGQRENAITIVDEARTLLYKMEQTDDMYSEAIVATALATARIGHDDDAKTLLEQSIQHAASIDLSDKRTKSLRNIAQAALDIGNNQLAATIVPLIDTIDDRAAILKAMIEQHETTPSHAINLLQSAWQRIEIHEKLWSLIPLITAIPMHSSQLVMGLLDTEEWVNEQLKRLG